MRSLGVCYITIDTKIVESIAAAAAAATQAPAAAAPAAIAAAVAAWIVPHFMRVIDITGRPREKKSRVRGAADGAIEFAEQMAGVLRGLDADFALHGAPDHVLVEYQMSQNDKSRRVMNFLIIYYVSHGIRVHIVGPSLKNKISFGPGLEHAAFAARYATAYSANKAHTKANFARWVAVFGAEAAIADIPKARMADIADAFMQILGWLRFGGGAALC